MSLINQMLKELDARSSEVINLSQAYGGQIRAVAKRRHIHPAWWLVLVLALLLTGLLAWVLLRPLAPLQTAAASRLPLKVDFDLDSQIQAPPNHSIVPERSAAPPAAMAQEARVINAEAGMRGVVLKAPDVVQPIGDAMIATSAVASVAAPISIPKDISSQTLRETKSIPNPENSKPVTPTKAITADVQVLPEPTGQVLLAKQVKELTPQQRAENEYRKAVLLMQQGKSADAISALEQALHLDTSHAVARQALIGLLVDTKRQDDAMQQAREGLALDPAQAGLAMILARLQLEKNELPSAIATLERSLQYGAGRADYQAFLAALLQRSGKHSQSVEHYMLAVQKAPQNGVWWMGLGISLHADSRSAEALEAFKRAKASNVLSPELLAFVESRMAELQR